APFVLSVGAKRRSRRTPLRLRFATLRANGLETCLAQPADLVADAGGVLEFQVAGVLVHLLLQRLDLRRLLGRRQPQVFLLRFGHPARLAASLQLARLRA